MTFKSHSISAYLLNMFPKHVFYIHHSKRKASCNGVTTGSHHFGTDSQGLLEVPWSEGAEEGKKVPAAHNSKTNRYLGMKPGELAEKFEIALLTCDDTIFQVFSKFC